MMAQPKRQQLEPIQMQGGINITPAQAPQQEQLPQAYNNQI